MPLEAVQQTESACAISGYHSDLYADALDGWDVQERECVAYASQGGNSKRVEVLWRNARCVELLEAENLQGNLFDV